MTDNDAPDIPPALTEGQWSKREKRFASRNGFALDPEFSKLRIFAPGQTIDSSDAGEFAALIALANAALHDEDPRKIRREHVTLLREMAERIDNERIASVPVPRGQLGVSLADIEPDLRRVDALNDLADALESYLPPEPRKDTLKSPTGALD